MAERRINEVQQLKMSAEKRKINKKKQNIQMILMQKRNLFANQIGEKVEQNNKPQEEEEEIFIKKSEDPRGIKGLDLSKHRKKRKKCRRRCWNCRSPTHYKNRCPFIRCYWCHKLGHTKANCHQRMIEYIFHRVKEDCARKEMKMQENKEKRKKKKEQKEYEKKNTKFKSKGTRSET